jgi:phosphoenolpyruvate synthase/pyruvate phosphate dikinase
MIGFRGASRYAHPAYVEGFALECRAMKRVREEMGFTNVILMIPFVRRVEEAENVIAQIRWRSSGSGAVRTGCRSMRCARSRIMFC